MRMRNPKNKDDILASCKFYLDENMFASKNKVHMEIGMGKGDFIINMAQKYPDINFIGVEKYSSVACKMIQKIKDLDIPNLKILICDAANLPEYLNGKISTIYLNFSDPWPKARHEKRRLTSINFLKYYDNLFKDKKTIVLKTDNDDFYAFSRESILNYGYTILQESLDLHSENISNVKTEYETKFASLGIKIKYLKVEK